MCVSEPRDGLGLDLDITYALGELQNVQTELEQYFGKDGSHADLPQRIARVEAVLACLFRAGGFFDGHPAGWLLRRDPSEFTPVKQGGTT